MAGLGYGTFQLLPLLPFGGDEAGGGPAAAEDASDGLDPQPTLVFATFAEDDREAGATQVTVLAYDRDTGQGTVLLVPITTAADIPAHGLLQLGRAYGYGGGPLLDATLDNLMGIDLDHVVGVSRQGWASLFTRIGGMTVEVSERLDERLADGTSRNRFRPGSQFLDGPRLAEYLTFEVPEERELEALPRVQAVLLGMFDAVAADPAVLDPVFSDGSPMLETSATPDEVRSVLTQLAEARERDQLTVMTLPVTPLGSGDESSYRVDEERLTRLVEERFTDSVPEGRSEGGRSVQILNGNGAPGIGQQVAQRLIPDGFRVVLTGNADHFEHAETRIIIYEDTPEQVARAERVKELLGVGMVERSLTPQGVVDLTIVVGRDFLGPSTRAG